MKVTVTKDANHLIIIQQPNPLQPADVIRVPLDKVPQLLADIRRELVVLRPLPGTRLEKGE